MRPDRSAPRQSSERARELYGPGGHGVSPSGSSEAVLVGMKDFMQFIRGLPGAAGEIFRFIGSFQEGTHGACDASLEG